MGGFLEERPDVGVENVGDAEDREEERVVRVEWGEGWRNVVCGCCGRKELQEVSCRRRRRVISKLRLCRWGDHGDGDDDDGDIVEMMIVVGVQGLLLVLCDFVDAD